MTPDRWQHVKQIYLQIRGEPPDRRVSALRALCGDDQQLRAEVESLLRYDDRAADFLEDPALRLTVAREAGESDALAAGCRIGGYTIIREIAAGGMGVVYEAQQEHPHRVVALKVMKTGLTSASARRRFEDESETLARLQHPGIAQVYEAGTHAVGGLEVPYFAMELVEAATTITEYASARNLDPTKRIELFLAVCDAVHHGHQKGVIHRDLKPANILVSATGQPKVIDFGIARMLDPAATAVATQTATGQLVGTLQYMSPEQIDGDHHELDVRSDVYALGVVLFELLCGQLPYDVTRCGIYAAARMIKERPPLRPSAIDRALRGDLETIILRCLEKDRGRRYQSVGELAADLRRHLRHEPIEARRDSTFYVLRRNLYRHRWATAVAVVVGGAAVATAWALFSRAQAEEARMRSALSLARTWTHDNAPVAAAQVLWREFLKRDCDRTRFALWEFYLKYPRVYADAECGSLTDVEYSPSGRWLAAVADEGHVVVFDAEGWTVRDKSLLPQIDARALKFSPGDPVRLYIGDRDGWVRIFAFDEETGLASNKEELARLCLGDAAAPDVSAVGFIAVSPCGRWLAAGSDFRKSEDGTPTPVDARIRLWRIPGGELMHEYREPGWAVSGLAFSGDGQMLAITLSRYEDGYADTSRVLVLRTATGEPAGEPKLSGSPRRGALFSEDGTALFSGGNDLLAWNIQGNAESKYPMGKTWGIRALAAGTGPLASCVVAGCGDGSVRCFDALTGRFLPVRGYHDIPVADPVDLAVSPDGRHVASVARDGLSVWRFVGANDIRLSWPLGSGDDVALAADGLVATHTVEPSDLLPPKRRPAVVELWSAGSRVRSLAAAADCLMALSADGHRLALYSPADHPSEEGNVRLRIRFFASPDWTEGPLAVALDQPVTTLAWLDPRGRFLLVGFKDGRVAVGMAEEAPGGVHTRLTVVHQFGTEVTRFAIDDRGEWLAACSEGGKDIERKGRVVLWRARDLIRHAAAGGSTVRPSVAFEADSRVWSVDFVRDRSDRLLIATAGRLREVKLWDAGSGAYLNSLVGHGDAVRRCLAVGPNRLVTSSDDLTVRLWDVSAGEELCVLARAEAVMPRIAVADGRIAIGGERLVRVLDLGDADRAIRANAPARNGSRVPSRAGLAAGGD